MTEDMDGAIVLPGITAECIAVMSCPGCGDPMVVVALSGRDACPHCKVQYMCWADEEVCYIRMVEKVEDPVEHHTQTIQGLESVDELREYASEMLEAASLFEERTKTLRKIVSRLYSSVLQECTKDEGTCLYGDSILLPNRKDRNFH